MDNKISAPKSGISNPAVNIKRGFSALLFAFVFLGPLAAQETTGNYFIHRDETGSQQIIQRLAWPGDENASGFEVVVERGTRDNVFTEIHKEKTTESFMEISLGPGRYRYQVRVFNLLNQFEYATNWASFNIILAVQPGISQFTPDAMYIHEDFIWNIQLAGENFVEYGEVWLVPDDPEGARLTPAEYIPAETSALLVFDKTSLIPGVYTILIRNPGGLEASAGPLVIAPFSPNDIELSLGYAPLIPVTGYLFDAFTGFAPWGGNIKLSFIFLKRTWGFLGIEADAHLNYLSDTAVDADITALIADGTANLLYRKLLPWQGFVFNARLGAGIGAVPLLLEFDYGNFQSDPLTSWVFVLNLGTSLEWRFTGGFFAELGVDYTQAVSGDSPLPGFLRPALSFGRRFR